MEASTKLDSRGGLGLLILSIIVGFVLGYTYGGLTLALKGAAYAATTMIAGGVLSLLPIVGVVLAMGWLFPYLKTLFGLPEIFVIVDIIALVHCILINIVATLAVIALILSLRS